MPGDSLKPRPAGGPAPRAAVAAVTFDVTGTLIHSPRLGEIYAEVLGRHGLAADPARVRELIPVVWRELDCRAERGRDRFTAEPGGPEAWWHRFLTRMADYLETGRPSRFATAELFARFGEAAAWEVYPEVPAVLGRLAAMGIRLAAVSNWDHRLPGLFADLGLGDPLPTLVYSSGLGIEKPDPRIFLDALGRLGVEPQRAVHVGDSVRQDVEGALAAGMGALHLDRSGAGGDLADLSALPRLLGESAGRRRIAD